MPIIKNPLTVISGNDNILFRKLVDRSITEVTAEDLEGVTSIGSYAFSSCTSLTSIIIPNGVISIQQSAFQNCINLINITMPNTVTSIGYSAFNICSSLTSIIISNSITRLENYTFSGCSSLTSIIVPNNIVYIGDYVFRNCSNLVSVTVLATTPPNLHNTNSFENTNNCPIYVPAESVEAYQTASNWVSLASRIQAIPV